VAAEDGGLSTGTVIRRGIVFFGWFAAFMALMALVGLIPTAFVFIIAYMRAENREPWRLSVPIALATSIFIYYVFDQFLAIPWPATLLGKLVPMAHIIPSV
jgi:hypothetical protein